MEKKSKSKELSKETGIQKRMKNLEKGKWKKGQSGNPKGYQPGQRHFATIYREALEKLAKANNKTAEELETEILQKGLVQARQADYRFYKDTMDRIHGQPTQKVDMNVKAEKLEEVIDATKEILNG